MTTPPTAWATSLGPGAWARANRELLAKLITELAFEQVLEPEALGGDGFRLDLGPAGVLAYSARERQLGHHRVDPASLRHRPSPGGTGAAEERPGSLPEVTELVGRAAPVLGLDPSVAAGLVGELSSTLLSDAWQLTHGRPADELVDADPVEVDGAMRGHPWIVAGKGRVGFDAGDLARYTPEANRPVHLRWLAAAPGVADRQAVDGLDHDTVVREQVGDEAYEQLRETAARAGLDPATATFLPVHPWQWRHRIATLHGSDLIRGRLVDLGVPPARYRPQQSVRTMVDVDHPERRYLKLPLSILNTSVYRGLVRDRALAAPALSQWYTGLAADDPFLRETGLILLGEEASVSVAHPALEAVPEVPYQHTEMLGAMWRQPVTPQLRAGERAVTLAAVLHRDPDDRPYLGPVIERSGLTVDAWVRELHDALLPPLVHLMYRFGLMFSPHAQNCLLVTEDHRPSRLAFKDFADDAVLADEPLPEQTGMPEIVRRALGKGVAARSLPEWLQGGLLVCVYRYLSELLEDGLGYPEAAFWDGAAATLAAYHERMGDTVADRAELFDLRGPTFPKLCLNRLRWFEDGYRTEADRPYVAPRGVMPNPLHR